MTLVVPNVGEVELLDKMLKDALGTNEDFILKLFSALSPSLSKDSVAGDFTEASFTGYSSKTLIRANWNNAAILGDKATSTYNSEQIWSVGSTETILGYYIVGSVSGVLLWAEGFPSPIIVNSPDLINITPKLTLNSDN